jgi:glycosyltransferase involved in cell wall biosynthesis
MNLLYVFNFNENDVGPKKHASEVLRNTRHNIKYISNIRLDSFDNYLAIVNPRFKVGVFINIQLFQLLCYWYIIKNRKVIDLIIVRQSMGFFVLNFLLKVFRVKVVTEVNGLLQQDIIDRGRGPFSRLIIRALEYLNLTCSDLIVSVHGNIKQSLVGFYGERVGKKILVVENGVDLEPPSSPEHHGKLIIGYLGSFAHREGVDFLPQVSLELALRKVDHEFYMVGGSPDEVDTFRSMLSAEVVDFFRFYGYVDYLKAKEILKECHLFIHLRRPIRGVTDSQGCPLKTLDYLSVGRCVLATSIQSYKFLEENNLGVLVPYSLASFERNVAERIAAMNDVSLENFYNKGQSYLIKKTWKHQVEILDSLLESI